MYSAAVAGAFPHKDNNGDDIKDNYGQTFDDEDHKPWNTLRI